MFSTADLARELAIDEGIVEVFAGQLAGDPDLVVDHEFTDSGADLVRAAFVATVHGRELTAPPPPAVESRLLEYGAAWREAVEIEDAYRVRLRTAVLEEVDAGLNYHRRGSARRSEPGHGARLVAKSLIG